jgi:hypothetical protein
VIKYSKEAMEQFNQSMQQDIDIQLERLEYDGR